jgi:hypothetical protein
MIALERHSISSQPHQWQVESSFGWRQCPSRPSCGAQLADDLERTATFVEPPVLKIKKEKTGAQRQVSCWVPPVSHGREIMPEATWTMFTLFTDSGDVHAQCVLLWSTLFKESAGPNFFWMAGCDSGRRGIYFIALFHSDNNNNNGEDSIRFAAFDF